MLACLNRGSGHPVVLLHAFPLSSQMWSGEISALEPRWKVIAPDLPGFGRSPRMQNPSIPGMAREVAALLDALGISESIRIGGLSMGGYVALEFLRQFPGRVHALCLMSTRAAADTPEAREKRFRTIEMIDERGLAAFIDKTVPNLLGKTSLESRPEVVEKVRRLASGNEAAGVSDALRAMAARGDSSDLLPKIHFPSMVINGEEDTFVPVAEAQNMAEKIPGCRMEVIPQAGHVTNLEQPAVFLACLQSFLS